MNHDCWYYVLEQFFSQEQKHNTLKLVCKLFYRIVQEQTQSHFNKIKSRIHFQDIQDDEKEGYKIYLKHFADINLTERQYAWVLPLQSFRKHEITCSSNFLVPFPSDTITFSLSN